jgi:hypothetical protein
MPNYCVGDFMYAGQPVRAVDDGKKAQHNNKREMGCDKAHEWLGLLSYQKLKFFKSLYEKPKYLWFVILGAAKNLVVLMNSGILHFVQDDIK